MTRNEKLPKKDLAYVNLANDDFTAADLRDSDLHHATLRRTRLTDADLRRTDLHGARLEAADLAGADLTGADLRGADLRGTEITAARSLAGTRLVGAVGLDPNRREEYAGRGAQMDDVEEPAAAQARDPQATSLTTAQVAERLGVSESAVRQRIKRGALDATKAGRVWRVALAAADDSGSAEAN
jgi:excisionase family DNA binding protein